MGDGKFDDYIYIYMYMHPLQYDLFRHNGMNHILTGKFRDLTNNYKVISVISL